MALLQHLCQHGKGDGGKLDMSPRPVDPSASVSHTQVFASIKVTSQLAVYHSISCLRYWYFTCMQTKLKTLRQQEVHLRERLFYGGWMAFRLSCRLLADSIPTWSNSDTG
jgi:hypothetical protein